MKIEPANEEQAMEFIELCKSQLKYAKPYERYQSCGTCVDDSWCGWVGHQVVHGLPENPHIKYNIDKIKYLKKWLQKHYLISIGNLPLSIWLQAEKKRK